MTIDEARELKIRNLIDGAELLRNPSNREQWFMMLGDKSGKKLMLVDAHNHPIVNSDIEELFKTLKSIGINRAEIIF